MEIKKFSENEIQEVFDDNFSEYNVFNLIVNNEEALLFQVKAARKFLKDFPDAKSTSIVVPCHQKLIKTFNQRNITLHVTFLIDLVIDLSIEKQGSSTFIGIPLYNRTASICRFHLSKVISFFTPVGQKAVYLDGLNMEQAYPLFLDPYKPEVSNDLNLYIQHHCQKYTTNLKQFFGISEVYDLIDIMDEHIRNGNV